jgi:hypothetical protein
LTDFWNSETTEASWQGLQELSKEIDFVLIGGWATYMYAKLQKSKDIDIIIEYSTLRILESKYRLIKNERPRKYEIKRDKYDIDIYLPNYSPLALPPKDILSSYTTRIEGFTLPTPEALMVLKLGAAADRGQSAKGAKDSIDILGLLFNSGLDLRVLEEILSKYGLADYTGLLASILKRFDRRDLHYLNMNENSFAKLRRSYLDAIRSAGGRAPTSL